MNCNITIRPHFQAHDSVRIPNWDTHHVQFVNDHAADGTQLLLLDESIDERVGLLDGAHDGAHLQAHVSTLAHGAVVTPHLPLARLQHPLQLICLYRSGQ